MEDQMSGKLILVHIPKSLKPWFRSKNTMFYYRGNTNCCNRLRRRICDQTTFWAWISCMRVRTNPTFPCCNLISFLSLELLEEVNITPHQARSWVRPDRRYRDRRLQEGLGRHRCRASHCVSLVWAGKSPVEASKVDFSSFLIPFFK